MGRAWWKTGLVVVLGILVLAGLGGYGYYRYQYPYGRTHQCSRAILLALIQYAGDHGEKFPAGEATPEASLCLLYRTGYSNAEFLAGRAKSPAVAKKILEGGGLLGPDTCDWHYTEGLTHNDSSEIAILWGKSSLGHVGQNLHGGHEVGFIDGHVEVIPADKWEAFLAEQAELLARRKQPAND